MRQIKSGKGAWKMGKNAVHNARPHSPRGFAVRYYLPPATEPTSLSKFSLWSFANGSEDVKGSKF